MKFIVNKLNFVSAIIFLLLTNPLLASDKTEDCSRIEGEYFVQKTCTVSESTVVNIPIIGLPKEIQGELNSEHLLTALDNIGTPQLFHTKQISGIDSLIPLSIFDYEWYVTYEDGNNKVFNVQSKKKDTDMLWYVIFIIYIIMLLLTPFLSSNRFQNPKITLLLKPSLIGLVLGVIFLSTKYTEISFNQFFGIISVVFIMSIIMIIATRDYTLAVIITELSLFGSIPFLGYAFAITNGLMSTTTLGWLIFCLIVIALDYKMFFYYRNQEKKKLTHKA